MEWIGSLHGSIVGLDSAPPIYFIEKHPDYLALVHPSFDAMDKGDIRVVTSSLTLTEVLVHPHRHADQALVQQYSEILLQAPNLTMVPVSAAIAGEAARLRAIYGMRTPDAIQAATAISENASAFLTNDIGFKGPTTLKIIVLATVLKNLQP